MSFAVAVFGLLLLVAIHELGHFTAAKATGMRALRFYLGFPPADRQAPLAAAPSTASARSRSAAS